MRAFDRMQPIALLFLRIALGTIMIHHGYPKVAGGLPQHMAMVAKFGMPAWMGYLSTAAEFFGGILLILGFLTRFASLAICAEMAVIIAKVQWKNGLRGFELELALAGIAFALIFFGAGPVSLDRLLFGRRTGPKLRR